MADDGCKVRSGGCDDGESGETMPEVSQGRIVGHDSDRVIDDSTNDKIGILSHEGMDATDRPYLGACAAEPAFRPEDARKCPSARQLVRQDGWQAAVFGGRNRPSLLMVAHQLARASEVTSS